MEAFALSSSSQLRLYNNNNNNSTFLSLSSLPSFPTFKPKPYSNSNSNSNSFPKIFTSNPSSELTIQLTDSIQNAPKFQANLPNSSSMLLFPDGFKHWLVNFDGPTNGFSSKAQVVDFCVEILSKVLGNERDAQMCLYHVSWKPNFGFCCVLDDECAQELIGVPGVLSVHPDESFESETKDYGGGRVLSCTPDSAQTTEISKTKLFITGLSFYTSEKTLRSAFEPFGELAEVKVIMDKISKRSKGYAFVEYTTEEATTTALQEMNGKIINGWMIVVDRAKSKPNYSRGRPKSMSLQDRKLT